MINTKDKPVRMDMEMKKIMDEIITERIAKRLDRPRELSYREITRMMRNAPSFPMVRTELINLPRNKNAK